MRVVAIRDGAEKLIREHGETAYDKACEAVRAARRHRNVRLEKYLIEVTREIGRRSAMDKDRHAIGTD
jgi:hypothetical protein